MRKQFPGTVIRPKKKKMFVCPFLTDPKFRKTTVGFLFYFIFFIFNFVFLNKNVQNEMSEYIVTFPKRYFNQM